MKKIRFKFSWSLFVVGFAVLIASTQMVGRVFFFNRTESMPRGLYLNIGYKTFDIGDDIVFYSYHLKRNLLKHVAAKSPSEFCVVDGDALFVDGKVVAEQNIQKYRFDDRSVCVCQRLHDNELLVLGEHPNSYDSRYFGPIKLDDVIARVEFLWGFD